MICINKPAGFTSFDVIAKMRGILKMKRLGHAGTLDPMATGVLPVFAGRATKACDIIPDRDKTYRAGFKLGITTDTQDITGAVISEKSAVGIGFEAVEKILERFRGDIMQVPPMYSAVSVNGKRLYELARKGVNVEREARPVTIYGLELLEYDTAEQCGMLEISCSKGTYIRTLINDMGDALGCGGTMTSLVRTRACGFDLEDCVTLEQLQAAEDVSSLVKPVEELFSDCPSVRLHGVQERMYRNGVRLDLDKIWVSPNAERVSVYGEEGFIGTAVPDREKGILRSERNFFI